MDELIVRAKQGDDDALREIMAQYGNLIHSIANRYYLVGGDKEDLLQECMVGVFSAVCKYNESKGAFPSFVKLCVLRRVIDAVDRDNNLSNRPLANYVELSQVTTDMHSDDPLDMIIDREVLASLTKAIYTVLTPAERDVLLLFVEGYSYKDISAKLGISYKSVDGTLQRAKKKLSSIKE